MLQRTRQVTIESRRPAVRSPQGGQDPPDRCQDTHFEHASSPLGMTSEIARTARSGIAAGGRDRSNIGECGRRRMYSRRWRTPSVSVPHRQAACGGSARRRKSRPGIPRWPESRLPSPRRTPALRCSSSHIAYTGTPVRLHTTVPTLAAPHPFPPLHEIRLGTG
jgi:hypothetical protein